MPARCDGGCVRSIGIASHPLLAGSAGTAERSSSSVGRRRPRGIHLACERPARGREPGRSLARPPPRREGQPTSLHRSAGGPSAARAAATPPNTSPSGDFRRWTAAWPGPGNRTPIGRRDRCRRTVPDNRSTFVSSGRPQRTAPRRPQAEEVGGARRAERPREPDTQPAQALGNENVDRSIEHGGTLRRAADHAFRAEGARSGLRRP